MCEPTREDALLMLEEMRSRFSDGFSPSDRRELAALHLRCFGRAMRQTSCRDCWRDAFLLIYNHLKQGKEMTKMKEYRLRKGIVVRPKFGSSTFFTADSITDAAAEDLLRENAALIAKFEAFPKDWRERIAPKVEEEPKAEAPAPIAEEPKAEAPVQKKQIKKKK